jgi:hypothetical protein
MKKKRSPPYDSEPPKNPSGEPHSQERAPSPKGHHRSRGIGLLQGPRGALFLMIEVPMYESRPPRHPMYDSNRTADNVFRTVKNSREN